jgi:hypothetical protein
MPLRHLNMAHHSPGAASQVAPSRHPLRWLLLMGGLGVGAPLLGRGLLMAMARLGGWTWAFLGPPVAVSWEFLWLVALFVAPAFVSLLLWWFLLVTRAPRPWPPGSTDAPPSSARRGLSSPTSGKGWNGETPAQLSVRATQR